MVKVRKEYKEGLGSWGREKCSVHTEGTIRSLGEGCFEEIMELKCVGRGNTQGPGTQSLDEE